MSAIERHATAADGIEVAEVVRTVRRGWRAVIACTLGGIVLAIAVLMFAPRLYEGSATVLARASSEGGSLLSRLGSVGEMLGASGVGGVKSPLETEIQVLSSRVIAGRVMDSLRLQARVLSPRGTPSTALVQAAKLGGAFAPVTYTFERLSAGEYRVTGGGFTGDMTQGEAAALPQGSLTLATGDLPAEFRLKLYDREDGISRLQGRMSIGKAGGDVARVQYHGDDSVSAASVPNAMLAMYLDRRHTTDRGTNQKRVEFLTSQVEATASELGTAERSLRKEQERSGVLDAQVYGRLELEQAATLRKALIEVEVEEGAITQLLQQAASGSISGRQLAVYPAFLRGASLNSLVSQLGELETARLKLLEKRTEADPEVVQLTQSIKVIEGQFVPMAQTYASALGRQRSDIRAQLDSMQRRILSVPAAAEAGGRLQRDVLRLSQIYAAMQAQLVQARLAAIDEGGDVRQLDVAEPPRKVWFPRKATTLAAGVGGGFIVGVIMAIVLGWFGRWMRDPAEMERATGVPTQRLQTNSPLLVGAGQSVIRTLLIVPVEERALAASALVAERLVRTAASRAVNATVLDLSSDRQRAAAGNGNGSSPAMGISAIIDDLEQRYGMVVVQLPSLANDATVAALRENRPVLLVAPPDRVNRAHLIGAVETLRRLQIPCAGIVIGDRVTRA